MCRARRHTNKASDKTAPNYSDRTTLEVSEIFSLKEDSHKPTQMGKHSWQMSTVGMPPNFVKIEEGKFYCTRNYYIQKQNNENK